MGPFPPLVGHALEAAFGPAVRGLEVHRGEDEKNKRINAIAHTEGRRISLSSAVKEDIQDLRSMEILAHEVSHALAGPGTGEFEVDQPGDPGEVAASGMGQAFRRWVKEETGARPNQATLSTPGKAKLQRVDAARNSSNPGSLRYCIDKHAVLRDSNFSPIVPEQTVPYGRTVRIIETRRGDDGKEYHLIQYNETTTLWSLASNFASTPPKTFTPLQYVADVLKPGINSGIFRFGMMMGFESMERTAQPSLTDLSLKIVDLLSNIPHLKPFSDAIATVQTIATVLCDSAKLLQPSSSRSSIGALLIELQEGVIATPNDKLEDHAKNMMEHNMSENEIADLTAQLLLTQWVSSPERIELTLDPKQTTSESVAFSFIVSYHRTHYANGNQEASYRVDNVEFSKDTVFPTKVVEAAIQFFGPDTPVWRLGSFVAKMNMIDYYDNHVPGVIYGTNPYSHGNVFGLRYDFGRFQLAVSDGEGSKLLPSKADARNTFTKFPICMRSLRKSDEGVRHKIPPEDLLYTWSECESTHRSSS